MIQLLFELTKREYETISGGEQSVYRDKKEKKEIKWINELAGNDDVDFNVELT